MGMQPQTEQGWGRGSAAAAAKEMEEEPHIERLPADLLAHVLAPSSFHDLAIEPTVAPGGGIVAGVAAAAELRGQRTGDDSAARLVRAAVNLRDLDVKVRGLLGCHITDDGLLQISTAECVGKLTAISLWDWLITDNGVVRLVSRAHSLQHLNIGGTFITDESLHAVANNCTNLKSIMLWSCRHVTAAGLVALVSKCPDLACINVGGMRVSPESFAGLLSISPGLRIRSVPEIVNASVQVS
ncbi:hypothetical protein ZWY2020_050487 [Hordeum vulgare]|nr:hypothetical protein ZWY2020_050487 [Hordeum vulgare]